MAYTNQTKRRRLNVFLSALSAGCNIAMDPDGTIYWVNHLPEKLIVGPRRLRNIIGEIAVIWPSGQRMNGTITVVVDRTLDGKILGMNERKLKTVTVVDGIVTNVESAD